MSLGKLHESLQITDGVCQKTSSVILFCSFGKDSLVLLDIIAPKFQRVVCVFMYFLPCLDHMDKWIKWAEAKYPNIEIIQIPHWNLSHILRSGIYCVPNPKVKAITLKNIEASIKLKYGIEHVFYGMKKADSLNRRLMLNTYDNGIDRGKVYPLMNWTNKDVLAYLHQHKLPSPIRYSKKASGGIGFNVECFLWLRENYPQDLQKIYNAFPLSKKILIDHDSKAK